MVTSIELSKEPSQMKSFRMSVLSAHRDKLLDADKWPENIHVRKFFKPRNGRQICSFNCNSVRKKLILCVNY